MVNQSVPRRGAGADLSVSQMPNHSKNKLL